MRILTSPLDWGLGHASRSAAVVKHLLRHHNEVILAGSGDSLRLLQEEFPSLKSIHLKSFSPWVPSWLPFSLAISLQVPYFFFCIFREYLKVQHIVRDNNIDLIISDNRYGLFSKKCRSAIITHQLSPIPWTGCPSWIRNTVSWGIAKLISKFKLCIIPDYPDHRLSGNLSKSVHSLKCKVLFTGPLSRYTEYRDNTITPKIKHLGILTGPKSIRTQYEKEFKKQFSNYTLITPESHSTAKEIAMLIQQAENIHSHSGYTTIMDLYSLGALSRAHLKPTPGQAEQEYLATLLPTSNL